MNDLLNPVQKNSLRVVLQHFEENLIHAQAWLDGHEEAGVLYQRKLAMSDKKKERAKQQIQAARELIGEMSRTFELPLESEDAAALIRAEMAICWADLLDSRANDLRRCGAVHPQLAGVLDPDIQKLAGVALFLTTFFGK
jgi:hypothetical protein